MTSVDVEETLRAHWREDGRGPEAEEALRRAANASARERRCASGARERRCASGARERRCASGAREGDRGGDGDVFASSSCAWVS